MQPGRQEAPSCLAPLADPPNRGVSQYHKYEQQKQHVCACHAIPDAHAFEDKDKCEGIVEHGIGDVQTLAVLHEHKQCHLVSGETPRDAESLRILWRIKRVFVKPAKCILMSLRGDSGKA